ncbi:hypothetical protein AX774_g5941 [Zancudomyces culisetae]|uniref:Uncharacterized protein n=1 Tax=Zancudomyces culisetae TaxID=1213189 RepID=A0A1R1PI66_ZANCU|nr:hypothetical protein AX774_g5941 [Zancudomyces culisetae]|eukprot:OMH80619.1 hypothetical protein AX774_g5941 [Zancudomyces culisetae]
MNIETIRSFIDSQNLPLCANVAPALSSVTFTPVLSKKLFFVVFPDIYNPEFFKVGAESRVNFIKLHSFPHHIEFDEIGNYFSSSFKKIGLSLYCVCA